MFFTVRRKACSPGTIPLLMTLISQCCDFVDRVAMVACRRSLCLDGRKNRGNKNGLSGLGVSTVMTASGFGQLRVWLFCCSKVSAGMNMLAIRTMRGWENMTQHHSFNFVLDFSLLKLAT